MYTDRRNVGIDKRYIETNVCIKRISPINIPLRMRGKEIEGGREWGGGVSQLLKKKRQQHTGLFQPLSHDSESATYEREIERE